MEEKGCLTLCLDLQVIGRLNTLLEDNYTS